MFYAFFMSSYNGNSRFKNKYFFACNDNIFSYLCKRNNGSLTL